MRPASIRLALAIVLVMPALWGCDRQLSIAPTHVVTATFTQPPPSDAMMFPPPTGPSRTFVFARELANQVQHNTKQSHFILYDNGAFVLQYPSSSRWDGRCAGAYRYEDGVLVFLFNSSTGRSVDEPWDDATATLEGDSLTVQYSEIMQHSDFDDAVYVEDALLYVPHAVTVGR